MKLSNQAMGAIMMALQKSLMEQSDITETLGAFDFVQDAPLPGEEEGPLIITNPPVVKIEQDA
tara:strand:- start:2309 stop:2497 length:189 start_codon:yes stop_codon:yes gene_type:complete